ncbi:MAG: hypothetical protein ACE5PT_07075 [Gemmatimonadales bacterium]
MRTFWSVTALVGAVLLVATGSVVAQEQPSPSRVEVSPSSLNLEVGDTVQLDATVYDSAGREIEAQVFFFARGRNIAVTRDGRVQALRGGEYTVFVFVRGARGTLRYEVPVRVAFPAITGIDITPAGERFFVGAGVRHYAKVIDAAGMQRPEVPVSWSTSDSDVATVDRSGLMVAHREGSVTLRAEAGGVMEGHTYRVVTNPIREVILETGADSARTGDVIHVSAVALDGRGRRVEDAPITYAVVSDPEDSVVAQFPASEIDQQGRFVAYKAGTHTVMAIAPGRVSRRSIVITPRHVSAEIDFVGQGRVRDVPTSDLWVWEGMDGRDYAVTGTWGARGAAYFWDVTSPGAPELIDSVVVDARTVNDVKVSEDGTVCVITREGASNRRNGIVILDCANPRDVRILSTFDDGLTGGVHNVFVYRNHVYAVNNGRKYDIINIEDPMNPRRVGVFELDTPGHALHDVWVVDGIAYSSNWGDGVVLVDVGNGIAGGSPSDPVKIAQYADFGGATHAAFPYRSPTGRFYVLMGDEIGRDPDGPRLNGRPIPRTPEAMAGYIHFVDFTDPLNPEEVARYEVPEAGSHNFWIEGDVLYAAFYNGGLRVVDISGELKGNLTYQGREMGRFMAYDPEGYRPNAPFTWGPQPHKGHIFIAEHNSGLWSVMLRRPALTP